MALVVRHKFHSEKSAGPDPSKVQAPHWNNDHALVDSVTGLPVTDFITVVPVGTIVDYCGHTPPPGWLECGGQLLPYANYPALYAALVKIDANVDISFSSPAVINWTAHGIVPGNTIWLGTSGVLPAPLSPGGKAYVLSAGQTVDTFRISGSFEGPAINTTTVGSGTHYGVHAPFGVEGTSFRLPDYRERVPVGHSNLGSLGTTGTLAANYGTGDTVGLETATLAMGNMPRHDHGGITGIPSTAHSHTVSGSGSGSGTTGNTDLTHSHTQNYSAAVGGGGGNSTQKAGSTDGQLANISTVGLNHSHPFSVTVAITGSTSTEQAHRHGVSLEGNNQAFSIMQPTLFVRKIIYTGV